MAIVRRGHINASVDQYTAFQNQVKSVTAANNQYNKTHGGTFATQGKNVNLGVVRRQAPIVSADGAASAGVGILGAAAIASPAIAPFAAAAGVGYGIYKLGESFNFW